MWSVLSVPDCARVSTGTIYCGIFKGLLVKLGPRFGAGETFMAGNFMHRPYVRMQVWLISFSQEAGLYLLLLMKWLRIFLTNILFLILFTPLCCFIVFLTMPSASLQELVFWKWNASHPEASLDGIHYWFGADDGCSGCLWLPEPLRAFLLQDNNKQQNARKNPRTGSILWLCMPGTPNRIHTRASPFSSISLGYCGILFDTYFTP